MFLLSKQRNGALHTAPQLSLYIVVVLDRTQRVKRFKPIKINTALREATKFIMLLRLSSTHYSICCTSTKDKAEILRTVVTSEVQLISY